MPLRIRRPKRRTSRLLAAALVAGSAAAGAAVQAGAATPDDPAETVGRGVPWTRIAGGCGGPSATPVRDNAAVTVALPPAPAFTVGSIDPDWWRDPPVTAATWQLSFLGLRWLGPLAQRAADDRQTVALQALVDQVVAFHAQNPDPGDNRYGWDEGTAMRRLQQENCLYALTKSPDLVPGIRADVDVQFGDRYYGPPRHSVHNHGLMANLAVLRTAQLLGDDELRDAVVDRLQGEASQAWTDAGLGWEQSTSYNAFDVDLWRNVATAIDEVAPGGTSAPAIRALTDQAEDALAWLTEPDGRYVLLGDSDASPGPRRRGWTDRVFTDDQAGVAVGRWSWSDRATTYYTLRYGPPVRGHGHQERGGVTWSARGLRILVNPGRYTYDASPWSRYQSSAAGSNLAVPVTGTLDTEDHVALVDRRIRSGSHRWTLEDHLFGRHHVRDVEVRSRPADLTVTDRYDRRVAFRQAWHLAPSWRVSSRSADGHRVVLRSGRRVLTVTTTGRFGPVLRGSLSPVAGWHFPSQGVRVPAVELRVSARGSATTSFEIR